MMVATLALLIMAVQGALSGGELHPEQFIPLGRCW